jgi:hypothetical protein
VKDLCHCKSTELLDWTRWRLNILSDRDLAKELNTSAPIISKIRNGHQKIGALILLRILDLTDAKLRELPSLIDLSKDHWKQTPVRRKKFLTTPLENELDNQNDFLH